MAEFEDLTNGFPRKPNNRLMLLVILHRGEDDATLRG